MCVLQDKPHFDFIWDKVILGIIERAVAELDSDYKNKCDIDVIDLSRYKKKLEELYKKKREWLKRVYLPLDNEPILDMHKIGAVLCRSIIGYKPISFDLEKTQKYIEDNKKQKDKKWFIDNVAVNYKIAFYVSVGLVYIEMVGTLKKNKKDAEAKMVMSDGSLNFYPKSPHHEDFPISCIIGLMTNDLANRDFDYLSYSAMLFQLERYNYIKYGISLKDIFETEEDN